MTVYYSPAWMAEMDRRAPARTAVRKAELPISVKTRPTWALTVNIIRWRSCHNNPIVYLSGDLILEGGCADVNEQTPSWWWCLWGVKQWALLSPAEEAMRSKTTVWGSSLSACVVIALGGGKKKKGGWGEGGRGGARDSLCVCVQTWCGTVLYTGSRPVDSTTVPLAE